MRGVPASSSVARELQAVLNTPATSGEYFSPYRVRAVPWNEDRDHARADPVGAAYGEWCQILPVIMLISFLLVFVVGPICAHYNIDIYGPVFGK